MENVKRQNFTLSRIHGSSSKQVLLEEDQSTDGGKVRACKLRCFGKSVFLEWNFVHKSVKNLKWTFWDPQGENFVIAVCRRNPGGVFLFKIGTVAIKSGGPDVVEKLWHLERGDCTKQLWKVSRECGTRKSDRTGQFRFSTWKWKKQGSSRDCYCCKEGDNYSLHSERDTRVYRFFSLHHWLAHWCVAFSKDWFWYGVMWGGVCLSGDSILIFRNKNSTRPKLGGRVLLRIFSSFKWRVCDGLEIDWKDPVCTVV